MTAPLFNDDNDNDNILADELGREYIDCTPTWAALVPLFITAIRQATPQGIAAASEELQRMADAADRWNTHCKAQRTEDIGRAIEGKDTR